MTHQQSSSPSATPAIRSRLLTRAAAPVFGVLAAGVLFAPAASAAGTAPPAVASALVATAASSAPVLKLGSRGADVREWQRLLNAVRRDQGLRTLATDGVFGPATAEATRAFQRSAARLFAGTRNDPAVDGVVGPATREARDIYFPQNAVIAEPDIQGTIKKGSTGASVRAWQTQLNDIRLANRLPRLSADGLFGPATDAATRSFQRGSGLAADGVVGPRTKEAALLFFEARPSS